MSLLMIAIETTGLMKPDLPADSEQQPHLVELGCELVDDAAEPLSPRRSFCETVRSGGWSVAAGATRAHGVSSRRVAREGIPETLALWLLKSKCDEASAVISYQGDFTRTVITSILAREKHDRRDEWLTAWSRPGMPHIDLGTIALPLCRLPGNPETGGFRRPKIEEAYTILAGSPIAPPVRPDALAKLEMTKRIYAAMQARNVLEAGAA